MPSRTNKNGVAMINRPMRFFSIVWILVFAVCMPNAYARIDKEDQELIDAATCTELFEERADFVAAEKELSDAIEADSKSTIATNVIGVATFATIGLGFFSWNDNSDAKANLVEIRELRVAIDAAIQKKACKN